MIVVEEVFLKFKDVYFNYVLEIGSEENEIECNEYFICEERKFRDFYWLISDWIIRVEVNFVV